VGRKKQQVDVANLQTLYSNIQHDLFQPFTLVVHGRSRN